MNDKIIAIKHLKTENTPLEAGEKETKLLFEEATRKNVLAVIAHGNETRKMIKGLETQVKLLFNELNAQKAQIDQFKIQLAGVQTKLFGGGTV